MSRLEHAAEGIARGWCLPPKAPWWKRLPLIRLARAIRGCWLVANHQAFWSTLGYVDTGYDEWVIFAIARGWC